MINSSYDAISTTPGLEETTVNNQLQFTDFLFNLVASSIALSPGILTVCLLGYFLGKHLGIITGQIKLANFFLVTLALVPWLLHYKFMFAHAIFLFEQAPQLISASSLRLIQLIPVAVTVGSLALWLISRKYSYTLAAIPFCTFLINYQFARYLYPVDAPAFYFESMTNVWFFFFTFGATALIISYQRAKGLKFQKN